MPTNYEAIVQEHRRYYGEGDRHFRIYGRLYADKTHFVHELIQNADDAKSKTLQLVLCDGEILAWNDGRLFDERDVKNICSVGLSEKDLTQIGTFGFGFKAVYAYTDNPEIYSGEESFRIQRFVEPEGIDGISPEIKQWVDEGKTVFSLPFKNGLRPEYIEHLKERLRNLHERTLLFLRHLEIIQWRDERDGQGGAYLCNRRPHEKIPDALKAELSAQVNGNEQTPETFLVFRKEVQPTSDVIEEFLRQAEYEEERERIQRSARENQPIDVAFRLRDGQIVPSERCVLFAYLPTEKETHLRFLIQARYQTTPARDNIPTNNAWNRWLIQETANFLPEILSQIKAMGLLTPAFLDVLPIENDNAPDFLRPISEALKQTLEKGEFIPTDNGGYANPRQVFYPHTEGLRELLINQDLVELTKVEGVAWLHRKIRDIKEHRRRFEVVKAAGVREVGASQVVAWLMEKRAEWFRGKEDEWLRSFYLYLKGQEALKERLKKLPLVRLENGEQVCADQLIFFPPEQDEEREELKPLLSQLPIVRSALLECEERADIEAFLKTMGIKPLKHQEVIRNWLLPQYRYLKDRHLNPPSVEENRAHVRYLFKALGKKPFGELLREISETPLLWAYKGVQKGEYRFVRPQKAYLPQAYTGEPDLEIYFAPSPEVWFVDDGYLEPDDKAEDWCEFLKELDCADLPRQISIPLTRKWELRGWKKLAGNESDAVDIIIEGLEELFAQKLSHDTSKFLWQSLLKLRNGGIWRRSYGWDDDYRRRDNRQHSVEYDTSICNLLQATAWLPDGHGNFHKPAELFAPNAENRRLMGNSVAYLHPDFNLIDQPARRRAERSGIELAERLGINLNANVEGVLNYLRTLSGSTDVDVKTVEPLYRFLDEYRDDTLSQEFAKQSLIFTPTPQPRWWRTREVFWEDESPVFGDSRGYLKQHYPETLKPFFISVKVSERAATSEHAATLDYARAVRELASGGQVTDEIRKRLHVLYRRLWNDLQDRLWWLLLSGEWQKARDGKCWLGRKGKQWGFFHRTELVWNDNDYFAQLFKEKLPFWEFNDLQDFAKKYLELKRCSQAQAEFRPIGGQNALDDWSEKMRSLAEDINCFLESPGRKEQRHEEASPKILSELNVRLVEQAQVTYILKSVSVIDPEPRSSYLDSEDSMLWLLRDADKQEYPELIGDALQDYFGVSELREFVKDLLMSERGKVLRRWQQRGLKIEEAKLPAPEESKRVPEPTMPPKAEPLISSGLTLNETEANVTPAVSPTEVVASEKSDTITPPRSHQTVTDVREESEERQTRSGGGGSGEGAEHRNLKEKLAMNPVLLGPGLRLVKVEHKFASGDRVDILLEDNNGVPVVVEVETYINPGNELGLWQAIKYKHLIAVERQILCQQARSILVAPSIPDDIKAKCDKFGVEPKEIQP